jgi:tetratricopeptide (TPR) repeat protein
MTKANRQEPHQQGGQARLLLLVIFGFGLTFWIFMPKRKGPNPPPPPTFQPWVPLSVVALFISVCILVFAIQIFRSFDLGVRRANKRALAGDLDGAIEDLREQIEDKGPTQERANALGVLLMRHERWAEAVALFRKAEEIGASKGVCKANLGLALLKDGKHAEALPVLQEALHVGPKVPVMTCLLCLHACLALAELGRWNEALEQFQAAEEAAAGLRKTHRSALADSFDKCRQKLEEQPRDKPKPEGLAEL